MSKRVLILSSSPQKTRELERLMRSVCERCSRRPVIRSIKYSWGKRRLTTAGVAMPAWEVEDARRKTIWPQILDEMIAADVIVLATPVLLLHHVRPIEDCDRPDGRTVYGNHQQRFLFHRHCGRRKKGGSGADHRRPAGDSPRCLRGAKEKGIVYGTGACEIGDILASRAMKQAYEMGKAL